MIMHELLIQNGFVLKGECKICNGKAMEYWKIVNGRTWTAKVNIEGRSQAQRSAGVWVERDRGKFTGPRGLIIFFATNLKNVLEYNGLTKT